MDINYSYSLNTGIVLQTKQIANNAVGFFFWEEWKTATLIFFFSNFKLCSIAAMIKFKLFVFQNCNLCAKNLYALDSNSKLTENWLFFAALIFNK